MSTRFKSTFRTSILLFLLLSLSIGVLGTYGSFFEKCDKFEWSEDATDSDEEDLKKEGFKTCFDLDTVHVYEVFLSHRIFILFTTPDCIREGHTGQVTPPPWS